MGTINYLTRPFGNMAAIDEIEAFLLSLECPKINLCVRRDNEAVIKFYDGLGYEEESAYYCGKRLIEDQ